MPKLVSLHLTLGSPQPPPVPPKSPTLTEMLENCCIVVTKSKIFVTMEPTWSYAIFWFTESYLPQKSFKNLNKPWSTKWWSNKRWSSFTRDSKRALIPWPSWPGWLAPYLPSKKGSMWTAQLKENKFPSVWSLKCPPSLLSLSDMPEAYLLFIPKSNTTLLKISFTWCLPTLWKMISKSVLMWLEQ